MCIAPHINSLGVALSNLDSDSVFMQGLACGVALTIFSLLLGVLICYLTDKF